MPTASDYALELKGLCKSFGKAAVVRGVDLAVRRGERVALIGPNGAGKSTLFNLVSGTLRPTSGEILLNGRRIDGLRPFEVYRRGLARSFQVSNLFMQLSAYDNLRCALLWAKGHRYAFWKFLGGLHDVNERAARVMEMIRLEGKRDAQAADLSYAEQRALELGITIAGDANAILLDEPTAGMSRSETSHFVRMIREVTAGKTLLVVEHDMGVVFDLADRVAVLVQGEVLACGEPDAVRADARVQAAYLGDAWAGEPQQA